MIASLAADGFAAHPIKSNSIILSVPGLIARLREAGVAGNKHVPHSYLRASAEQRLSLLQGLMDTDGTIDKVGSCELSPATLMGPPGPGFCHGHGTTVLPVVGPPGVS